MQKIIASIFFCLFLTGSIHAQNEFGAVGSYWVYDYTPHSYPYGGTTMITVEKDTLINGEIYKILGHTYDYEGYYPVPPTQGHYVAGLMRIVNDSVFFGDELVLDFTATLSDSLSLMIGVPIQLAVDSITSEVIDGFEYKKWHGQKLCLANGDLYPYESFTILESVGQISDYLFWNTDNCSIGGGFNIFRCYKNGDFTYPPSTGCEPLILSNSQVSDIPGLEIFPNPVTDLLYVQIENFIIQEIVIFTVEGKRILQKENKTNGIQIDTKDLQEGTYLIQIKTKDETTTQKFIKIR